MPYDAAVSQRAFGLWLIALAGALWIGAYAHYMMVNDDRQRDRDVSELACKLAGGANCDRDAPTYTGNWVAAGVGVVLFSTGVLVAATGGTRTVRLEGQLPGQHPAPPAATIADNDTEIAYGTVDWPPESLASICAELERRNVTYTLEGDELIVDTRHEALLDRMIADIDTGPPDTDLPDPAAGAAELVAYSTVEWSTSAIDTIVDELERHGVDYTFRDGELVVAAGDADRCNTIIAASRDVS